MKDGRSRTSRRNLGDHVPEALSPDGSVSVGIRLPRGLLARVDEAASIVGATRSEWFRAAAEAFLQAKTG